MNIRSRIVDMLVPLVALAATGASVRAEGLDVPSLVASATCALPGTEWEAFIPRGGMADCLAWAGVNQTGFGSAFSAIIPLPDAGFLADAGDVDIKLMTGLAAPEPPAIVLAGLALGSLACGRSLLRKRSRPVEDAATT